MTNFIAYYRVSTDKQGKSGLGLDAQREAVRVFLNGAPLAEELVEVESGRKDDRPKLAEAMALCRKLKAKLVIAKLDRLSRDVAFISALMKSGVEFIAADMPDANKLTLHIMAAIAEHEREMISQRTKAALQAAKARGVKLGTPANLSKSQGNAVRAAEAVARASDLSPILADIRGSGATSLRQIAAALNGRGITTPKGGAWSAVQVSRMIERVESNQ